MRDGDPTVHQLPNRKSISVIFITARSHRLVPSSMKGQTAMLLYEDLIELARMCARNARITTSRDVADEPRPQP